MKHLLIIFGFVGALSASTAYVLLDTFILEERGTSVTNSITIPTAGAGTGAASTTITNKTYRQHNTTIYVSDIMLGAGESIQAALAERTFGRNITETTSNIARSVNAALAVNGDFYGARKSGYVIRNGELLRDTKASDEQEDVVLWADGTMSVISEGDYSAQALLDKGALQVLSFGPGLIINSNISVGATDEVAQAMASNPRTAIGYLGKGHYVLVVADGRTSASEGLSLLELAKFMESLGVIEAYNLDGGGSSTMYGNGAVINQPTTNGSSIAERKVSDILYIK